MASLRQIRRRMRSVKGTAQITKAMELVAASKMRRAQSAVLAARPYSEKLAEVIANLAASSDLGGSGFDDHPLLQQRPQTRAVGVVLLTSDRGLSGGLNGNLLRTTTNHVLAQTVPVISIALGRKGRDFLLRNGVPVAAEFIGMGEHPSALAIAPVARVVIDDFVTGKVDRVELIYSQFVSTLVQRPVVQTLLPVQPAAARVRQGHFIYEPDAATVRGEMLPRYVEVQLYRALLETVASEHSARMVAMKAATENAEDILRDLNLRYNQARQASITNELIDIVGGVQSSME